MKKWMKKYAFWLALGCFTMLCLKTQAKAAVDQENTDLNPVVVEDTVPVAGCEKYKEMDDGFLKTFDYGSTVPYSLEFSTMEELQASTDKRLKTGICVKTTGFYQTKDGGAGSLKTRTLHP